jgi:hypothetical protein
MALRCRSAAVAGSGGPLASGTTAYSPAPPARPAPLAPASCSGHASRHERSIRGTGRLPSAMPMLRRTHDRSSRSSNGGRSRTGLSSQRQPTGRLPHDPAWLVCPHDRAMPARVNGNACALRCGAGHQAREPRQNHRDKLSDQTPTSLPRHARSKM